MNDTSRPEGRIEVLREAMTMALYVSIVLLAALAALPAGPGSEAGDAGRGVHGLGLVSLIWGTTIGLALAHWFAFRVTAGVFGGGKVSAHDIRVGLAQLAGAGLVALVSTVPVLIVGDGEDVQVATFVPAVILGVSGYLVARAAGRTGVRPFILGAVVMFLGLTVAAIKNFLAGH